jgi:hypothetical protein
LPETKRDAGHRFDGERERLPRGGRDIRDALCRFLCAGCVFQPLLRCPVYIVDGGDFDQHLSRHVRHTIQEFEAAYGREKGRAAASVRSPTAAGFEADGRQEAMKRVVNSRRARRMHEGDSLDHSSLNLPS